MSCYRVVVLLLLVVFLLNGEYFCTIQYIVLVHRYLTLNTVNIYQLRLQLGQMRLHPSFGLVRLSVVCVGKFASRQNCSLDLWVVEKASCKLRCPDAVHECVLHTCCLVKYNCTLYMFSLVFPGAAFLIFYEGWKLWLQQAWKSHWHLHSSREERTERTHGPYDHLEFIWK